MLAHSCARVTPASVGSAHPTAASPGGSEPSFPCLSQMSELPPVAAVGAKESCSFSRRWADEEICNMVSVTQPLSTAEYGYEQKLHTSAAGFPVRALSAASTRVGSGTVRGAARVEDARAAPLACAVLSGRVEFCTFVMSTRALPGAARRACRITLFV
jgi:hypothetical protein